MEVSVLTMLPMESFRDTLKQVLAHPRHYRNRKDVSAITPATILSFVTFDDRSLKGCAIMLFRHPEREIPAASYKLSLVGVLLQALTYTHEMVRTIICSKRGVTSTVPKQKMVG